MSMLTTAMLANHETPVVLRSKASISVQTAVTRVSIVISSDKRFRVLSSYSNPGSAAFAEEAQRGSQL